MKNIVFGAALAASLLTGSAHASVLTGDRVTFATLGQPFTVRSGVDYTVGEFRFDLDAGVDGNRFLFTTSGPGNFAGLDLIFTGLDFTDKSSLTGFKLVSTSLDNLSIVTTASSITFRFTNAFSPVGTVIDGFFETTASASAQVPLPGSLPLLALGLGALCFSRRGRGAAARG